MALSVKIKEWLGPKRMALGALVLSLFAMAFLLYLPADHFDHGDSVCLSVVIFDRECYACGMTRGVQHLLHLDFKEAASYNKLSFIVLPLGLYLVGSWIYKTYREASN